MQPPERNWSRTPIDGGVIFRGIIIYTSRICLLSIVIIYAYLVCPEIYWSVLL